MKLPVWPVKSEWEVLPVRIVTKNGTPSNLVQDEFITSFLSFALRFQRGTQKLKLFC